MNAASATPHLEHHLQQDVDRLRTCVTDMGRLAQGAVGRAAQALLTGDTTEAEAVILRDRLLDRQEMEGERLGLEMLVRHQPAGRNLRFIHASLRIVQELERVGDYAESIARQALRISRLDPSPQPLPPFADQATLATDMLQRAMRAYEAQDEALARETIPLEQAADQLRDQVRDQLLERHQTATLSIPGLITLLTVARRLERVTDQAKNICEEVVFLCSGHPLRHAHGETFRVLFVDDHHASLGHLAEAVARKNADARFTFHSAGLRPTPLDARVRDYLQRRGVDTSSLVSRSLGQVPALEDQDLVVALTEGARTIFPMTTAKTLCLVWPMIEPTTLKTPDAVDRALDAAWDSLDQRLSPLLAAVQRD